LTTLRDEGLIISVRGKGYYVAGAAADPLGPGSTAESTMTVR